MIDPTISMVGAGIAGAMGASWALGHWQGLRAGRRPEPALAEAEAVIAAAPAGPVPAPAASALPLPEGMTLTDLHEEISAFRRREKVLLQAATNQMLPANPAQQECSAAPFVAASTPPRGEAMLHPESPQPAVRSDAFSRV